MVTTPTLMKSKGKTAKSATDEQLKAVADTAYIAYCKAKCRTVDDDREGYHVSDYVNECMRQTAYKKLFHNKGIMSAESVTRLWMGKAVHELSNLGGIINESTMCYDLIEDKAVPIKDGKIQFPKGRDLIDFIVGTPDDVLHDEALGNIIVDKKTMEFHGYIPKKPYDHHVEQLNLYRVLLNKCRNMDAKWGCSFYIDVGNRDQAPVRLAYPLTNPDITLAKLITKRDSLLEWQKTGKLPPRVISYACDGYCSFFLACFKEKD